jgi:TonB-dependent SusC/RagA subfamily outer membrane receptor
MKQIALITCFILGSYVARAQATETSKASPKQDSGKVIIHICMPSKSSVLEHPPLYVIKSRNKEFKLKSIVAINFINPDVIQSISVLKDSAATSKYGIEAKYGVILITVKDDKYPDLYKQIKKASKEK